MLKKTLFSITFVLLAVISSVKSMDEERKIMEERPKISKNAYSFIENCYNL